MKIKIVPQASCESSSLQSTTIVPNNNDIIDREKDLEENRKAALQVSKMPSVEEVSQPLLQAKLKQSTTVAVAVAGPFQGETFLNAQTSKDFEKYSILEQNNATKQLNDSEFAETICSPVMLMARDGKNGDWVLDYGKLEIPVDSWKFEVDLPDIRRLNDDNWEIQINTPNGSKLEEDWSMSYCKEYQVQGRGKKDWIFDVKNLEKNNNDANNWSSDINDVKILRNNNDWSVSTNFTVEGKKREKDWTVDINAGKPVPSKWSCELQKTMSNKSKEKDWKYSLQHVNAKNISDRKERQWKCKIGAVSHNKNKDKNWNVDLCQVGKSKGGDKSWIISIKNVLGGRKSRNREKDWKVGCNRVRCKASEKDWTTNISDRLESKNDERDWSISNGVVKGKDKNKRENDWALDVNAVKTNKGSWASDYKNVKHVRKGCWDESYNLVKRNKSKWSVSFKTFKWKKLEEDWMISTPPLTRE